MTAIKRSVFKWIASGGAFLTVLASSGCARHEVPQVGSLPAAIRSASAQAPVINLFGEVDGQTPGAARPDAAAGFQQHTYVEEGYDANVCLDPTGNWLIFASTRHSEQAKIYRQRVGGTSVTQLTSGPAEDAYPVFSPDGKRIAFCSTRSGNWDIYVMQADGRNVTQITHAPTQDIHPSFSPDGTRLVYCCLGLRSNQWELWTVNLVSGERKMIGFGVYPAWSPGKDGERIAFQRARARGSRWFSLWTLDLVDGEAQNLTEVAGSANAALVSPSWSPDGKFLAFGTIVRPALPTNGMMRGQQDVWVVAADGSGRRRLTDGIGTNLTPYWAVDNRVYFVSDRGGSECIWSVQAEPVSHVTAVAAEAPQNAKGVGHEAVGAADAGEVGH